MQMKFTCESVARVSRELAGEGKLIVISDRGPEALVLSGFRA